MSDIHVLSDTIDTDADCRLTSTDSVTVCQSYGTCTYTVRALYRYRYNVMYNINVMTNVVQCHDIMSLTNLYYCDTTSCTAIKLNYEHFRVL